MARLNVMQEHGVSLFPMFNILVCTLGVLIFILSTVVTISLGVGKSILIVPELPGGGGHSKTPIFIEWNGSELIAYPSKQKVHFDVDLRDIETYRETYLYMDEKIGNSPFGIILNDIYHNRHNKYIILLVRPTGFNNFTEVRGYLENKGVDIGYEPIDQEWNLRLDRENDVQKN